MAGDLSKSQMLRFSLKGTNDSYLALAEEKEQNAKKITIVLGGWGNKHSTIYWPQKGATGNRGWHGSPNDKHSYTG